MSVFKIGCAAVVSLALLGCERWQINGLVIQREGTVGTEEGIDAATATLTCPTSDPAKPAIWATVKGDTYGNFAMVHENQTGPTDACTVTISAKGFIARDYPIDHICARYKDGAASSTTTPTDGGTGELREPVPGTLKVSTRVCTYGFVLAEMTSATSTPVRGDGPGPLQK